MATAITEHDCDAKILEWRHHKVNDKPCIAIMFGITSGPLRGRRIDWTGWLTAKAIETTLRQLQAAGWKGGSMRTLDGLDVGNLVSLRIEPEAMQDDPSRVFPRVAWVNKIRTLAHATGLSDADLAAVDKLAAESQAKKPAASSRRPPDDDPDFGQ